MIGERKRRHAERLSLSHQLLDPSYPVEERIFGVQVEVDKGVGGHRSLWYVFKGLPTNPNMYRTLVIRCDHGIVSPSANAEVAKLADAPDLGSGGAILRGSSPLLGKYLNDMKLQLQIKVDSQRVLSTNASVFRLV